MNSLQQVLVPDLSQLAELRVLRVDVSHQLVDVLELKHLFINGDVETADTSASSVYSGSGVDEESR